VITLREEWKVGRKRSSEGRICEPEVRAKASDEVMAPKGLGNIAHGLKPMRVNIRK
jgi:hypothetical protein